jgi:hypothetical protein
LLVAAHVHEPFESSQRKFSEADASAWASPIADGELASFELALPPSSGAGVAPLSTCEAGDPPPSFGAWAVGPLSELVPEHAARKKQAEVSAAMTPTRGIGREVRFMIVSE